MAIKLHGDKQITLSSIGKFSMVPSAAITASITALAIAQFPLTFEEVSETSAQSGSESVDRNKCALALVSLHPIPKHGFVFISNESALRPRTGSMAVRGNLDLIIGVDKASAMLDNLSLSETKRKKVKLYAKRAKNAKKEVWDLATLSQIVTQLIIIGHMNNGKTAAFYMTRHRFRPFLYFPSEDIMLTTRRSYAWKYEERIGLRGSILLAILLREEWKQESLLSLPHVKTNFCDAWGKKKPNVGNHYTIVPRKDENQDFEFESDDSEDEHRIRGTQVAVRRRRAVKRRRTVTVRRRIDKSHLCIFFTEYIFVHLFYLSHFWQSQIPNGTCEKIQECGR